MKTLIAYVKTTIPLGLIGVLLGACSNEKVEIFDFECTRTSFEDKLYTQYDRTKKTSLYLKVMRKKGRMKR